MTFYRQICYCMYKPHTHIYLSVDIHLVFSHILAKLNNAALNVYVQLFIWYMLQFLLGTYLEVGILGHMVILCLKFEKISIFQSFTFPSEKYEYSSSLTPCPHILLCVFWTIAILVDTKCHLTVWFAFS